MKFSIPDKIIRLLIGAAGLIIFITQIFKREIVELVCGILGLISLITVLIDFCPFYYILGIKKIESRKKDRFY
jgi:hypothetical protein